MEIVTAPIDGENEEEDEEKKDGLGHMTTIKEETQIG